MSPHSQLVAELVVGKIQPSVVFSGTLKLWPIIGFQMDQFLYEYSIFVVLIGCICPPCNRGIAVFFHVAPYNFLCFQKGHIPLVFHLKYFLFFSVSIARPCVSQMILLAVCTSNFFQAIFLHVVQVLCTCLSSSTDFPVVSIFLAFEAPQENWDVLLNSLKTIADLHLLGSMGLIKCQDVSVGLDSLFTFSDGDSFIFVTPCFHKADDISSSVANANSW